MTKSLIRLPHISPRPACGQSSASRMAALALVAASAAACSYAPNDFEDPVFTGATANQQQILQQRQPTYADISSGGLPSAPRAGDVSRTELPPPSESYANSAYNSNSTLVDPAPASATQPATGGIDRGASPTTLNQQAAALGASPPKPVAPSVVTIPSEKPHSTQVASIAAAPPTASDVASSATASEPTVTPVAVKTPSADPASSAQGPAVNPPIENTPSAPASDTQIASLGEQPGGLVTFRWPARGRVISEFGTKPGGARNDGINIAVPEGAEVKASKDGTVIYAGNELKGYGNLVLVRHDGGWVTAYAHNSQLRVKRGDAVKRGDTIALAGATGSVSQPQLHFEIRQGNRPVDPRAHLPKE